MIDSTSDPNVSRRRGKGDTGNVEVVSTLGSRRMKVPGLRRIGQLLFRRTEFTNFNEISRLARLSLDSVDVLTPLCISIATSDAVMSH